MSFPNFEDKLQKTQLLLASYFRGLQCERIDPVLGTARPRKSGKSAPSDRISPELIRNLFNINYNIHIAQCFQWVPPLWVTKIKSTVFFSWELQCLGIQVQTWSWNRFLHAHLLHSIHHAGVHLLGNILPSSRRKRTKSDFGHFHNAHLHHFICWSDQKLTKSLLHQIQWNLVPWHCCLYFCIDGGIRLGEHGVEKKVRGPNSVVHHTITLFWSQQKHRNKKEEQQIHFEIVHNTAHLT